MKKNKSNQKFQSIPENEDLKCCVDVSIMDDAKDKRKLIVSQPQPPIKKPTKKTDI